MGRHERLEHEVDRLGGKAKEGLGRAVGDEKLEREGRGQQAGAELKQAAEKAKDAVKKVLDR
jgi:uncharacterized protein YjbJ (UPF0337 family)